MAEMDHSEIVAKHVLVPNLPAPTGTAPPAAPSTATMIDLYKLEYTNAAARYENIYKALWQNFTYLAALAAAILTFAKDTLGLETSSIMAAAVFILWYWSSFEPLNRYGDDTAKRLARIEDLLTILGMQPVGRELKPEHFGLRHFMRFGGADTDANTEPNRCWAFIPAVIGIIAIEIKVFVQQKQEFAQTAGWWAAFLFTFFLILYLGWIWYRDVGRRPPPTSPANTSGGPRVRNVIRIFAAVLHLFVLCMLLAVGPSWKLRSAQGDPPQTQSIQIVGGNVDVIYRNHPTTQPTGTNGTK